MSGKKLLIALTAAIAFVAVLSVLRTMTSPSQQENVALGEEKVLPSPTTTPLSNNRVADSQLVQKLCSSCHALSLVTEHRDTQDGWASVVDAMVVRGAQGSDSELARVVSYLAEQYSLEAAGGEAATQATHAIDTGPAFTVGEAQSRGIVSASAEGSPTRNQTADWGYLGHDAGGTRYSPLTQITAQNVSQLRLAWSYEMATRGGRVEAKGVGLRPRTTQATPLVIDGIMYITNPYGGAAALAADTGQEIWWHALDAELGLPSLRSLAYWPGDDMQGPAIFFATTSGFLIALDAATGAPIEEFGESGALNLRQGVTDGFPDASYGMNSPPAIYNGVLITGSRTQEQPALGPSGAVRGWDVRTGELLWTFHTIPQPGEENHEVWEGDSWRNRSGANNWGLMTVDAETGTAFIPLGTVTYDYYGGDRPGPNLYGNTLVALDVATGKLKWHYQFVHHDVWDYDLNAAPVLIEVNRNGEKIPAVAQITKQSLLFILNRETGEPIHTIEERPVPQEGFVATERPWPTQPHPVVTPPLARANFSADEIAKITPEHTEFCEAMLRHGQAEPPQPAGEGGLRFGPLYSAYDESGTIMFPGTLGGVNWHGMSYDPKLGYLIAAPMSLGEIFQIARDPENPEAMPKARRYKFWDDEKKWPCNEPPWGELVAVNVNTGEIAWRRPFGSYPELEALGFPEAGTPVMGGAISTAGGVTFAGGTLDNKLRAVETASGEELWSADVGAASHNIPSTYLGRDNRQYLAVVVSGGSYMRDPQISPVLLVYELPNE